MLKRKKFILTEDSAENKNETNTSEDPDTQELKAEGETNASIGDNSSSSEEPKAEKKEELKNTGNAAAGKRK